MEYYLSRAFEVARLSLAQLEALHAAESLRPRALMPQEIQKCFGLSSLRDYFGFSDSDSDTAALNSRVRLELETRKVWPYRYDLSSLDVDQVHAFDDRLRTSLELRSIDFSVGLKSTRLRSSV